MNRILSILLLCFVSFAVGARTYSVDEIPNVHLADSTRYVSNPDGILSEADVARIDDMMRTLSHTVMSAIQHENIEHQTTRAFYILARSAKVMFRAGVTIELRRRGYHYERVSLADFVS